MPSQTFRTNYRTHHKIPIHAAQRELTGDAQLILHTILNLLLRLLRTAKTFTDISVHGTAKLTAYFTLMTYCMVSKTEKLMVSYVPSFYDARAAYYTLNLNSCTTFFKTYLLSIYSYLKHFF